MATSAQAIVALVAVSVLLLAGAAVASTSYETVGEERTAVNESFTPDTNYTELEFSRLDGTFYTDSITVYDENGTEMVAGVDYDWNSTDGTIAATVDGDLVNDTSANATYTMYRPTDRQQTIESAVSALFSAGQYLPIALLGAVLFAAFGVFARA